MEPVLFCRLKQNSKPLLFDESIVSSEDLALINAMKDRGPIKTLSADDIYVRRAYILGVEPTCYQSIHPEGDLNGKKVTVLSELAKSLVGCPMMTAHDTNRVPWGRIFKAEVVPGPLPGYAGSVLKISYFFLQIAGGTARALAIDAGINAEYSISYRKFAAKCSICHTEMMVGMFLGMLFQKAKCLHKLGEKYDGQQCYWYPYQPQAVEVSDVYRGAYSKTKSVLIEYADEEEKAGAELLDAVLTDHNLEDSTDGSTIPPLAGSEPPATDGGITLPSVDNLGGGVPAVPVVPDPGLGHADPVLVKCLGCNSDIDYAGQPEVSMGAVACPVCRCIIDQTGKVLQAAPPAQSAGYWVCSKACGYWQDPVKGQKPEDNRCTCGASLVCSTEKPIKKTRKKYALCPNCDYSLETEAADELSISECPDCAVALEDSDEPVHPAPAALSVEVSLVLGKAFGPIKPSKSGAVHNEYFTLDGFKNLTGKHYVEPKYDGVDAEIHKRAGTVKIMTGTGTDLTEKFPNIRAEATKMKQDNFAVTGQIVKYKGGQRGTFGDVTAYINSKGPYEDYHFRFKLYDVMINDGKDIRTEILSVRQPVVDSFSNTDHIHKVKYSLVEGGEKIIRAIKVLMTREGAVVKSENMTYTPAGRNDIFKYKRQAQIDAKVTEQIGKTAGFIYRCEVGIGAEAKEIGLTYITKIDAKKGDILQVSVDRVTVKDDGSVSWYSPKVDGLRDDKTEPDSIATIKKIAADVKGSKNYKYTLTEIVPALLQAKVTCELFICGGLAVNGHSDHDVDLLTRIELTEDDKAAVMASLPEGASVDFIVNADGPREAALELKIDNAADPVKKYAKRFVIQRHEWGKKAHWDLRFGNPTGTMMWGFTCFKEPTKVAGGPKVQCAEKQYHDIKWMDFEGEIQPGNPGNPTKNLVAKMTIIDKGKYDFVQRKTGFVEVVLHGKEFEGRYVFREINVAPVKQSEQEYSELASEDKTKGKKVWVMWKTKDQVPGIGAPAVKHQFVNETLLLWEGSEIDSETLAEQA